MEINHLEKLGKIKTILISISILLVSLHTIYFYNSVVPEIETKKLIQQTIRFLITIGLLVMAYKGKNWARIVLILFSSFSVLGAIFALIGLPQSMGIKIPFIVML